MRIESEEYIPLNEYAKAKGISYDEALMHIREVLFTHHFDENGELYVPFRFLNIKLRQDYKYYSITSPYNLYSETEINDIQEALREILKNTDYDVIVRIANFTDEELKLIDKVQK